MPKSKRTTHYLSAASAYLAHHGRQILLAEEANVPNESDPIYKMIST